MRTEKSKMMGYEYEFLKRDPKEDLIFKSCEMALEEERQTAASMVKLAENQITNLQQRINFWNEVRKQNKRIAYGN